MQAAPADQRKLVELSEIDNSLAQATHRRSTLPELAKLSEMGRRRQALNEQLTAANTVLSDLENDQARLDEDLEPARARLLRNQQRVDAGSVTDSKSLSSLVDEIEHLKMRISKLEDESLDLMETVEAQTARRDHVSAERAELDGQARLVIAKRDELFAAIDAEIAQLNVDRDAKVAQIPEPLRSHYDKTRARLGSGVGELLQGRCTGCGITANAADLRRYEAAAPEEVLRCEECNRILVRPIN